MFGSTATGTGTAGARCGYPEGGIVLRMQARTGAMDTGTATTTAGTTTRAIGTAMTIVITMTGITTAHMIATVDAIATMMTMTVTRA